jgi:GNAT superfamily N-acetyltransferase
VTLPADLALRPAALADVPAIAALIRACDESYLEWAPAGWEPPPPGRELDRWHGRLTDGSWWTRVAAEPDGRLVGLVGFRQAVTDTDLPEPIPGRAHVAAVFTHPDRWREGIASGLLALAERAMQEQGYREVQLWTPEPAPARRFYEATGWAHDGSTRWVEDLRLPLVAYVKPL